MEKHTRGSSDKFNNFKCEQCSKLFMIEKDLKLHYKICRREKIEAVKHCYFFEDNENLDGKMSTLDKIHELRTELDNLRSFSRFHMGITMEIDRERIFEDSVMNLLSLSDNDLLKEFRIIFLGEISNDAGGLTKEWITLLIKEFFDESRGLFIRTSNGDNTYIVPMNYDNDLTSYYYAFGKILAKALLENIPVTCPLNAVFFKHLIGEDIIYDDLKMIDEQLYNSLNYMRENNIEGIFFSTFSFENDVKGKKELQELIPNGSEIQVTEENKCDYIEQRSNFELFFGTKSPISIIRDGFFSFFPIEALSGLKGSELTSAICGAQIIDVEEWREFTQYSGEYSQNHEVIQQFWRTVLNFPQSKLQALLQFVTGTSRVPIDGFRGLKNNRNELSKFTIVSVPYSKGILPRSHTCFNRLDLPVYPEKRILKSALDYITMNTFAFGIE